MTIRTFCRIHIELLWQRSKGIIDASELRRRLEAARVALVEGVEQMEMKLR
jgi:hypothetical protein